MNQSGFLRRGDLEALFEALRAAGYRCLGPQVRDGAIVYAAIEHAAQLPSGYGDEQGPGVYRLRTSDGPRCFAWANGPEAIKPQLFSPREILWRAKRDSEGALHFVRSEPQAERFALIGVRACDLAALALQDKHFLHHTVDPWYEARRAALLLVAVDCSHPAATCFCASTGDGPIVEGGADIALTELEGGFLARAYTPEGNTVCESLPLRTVAESQRVESESQAARATERQSRRLPGRRLRDSLFDNLEHPRWAEVAERCLSCGNCANVCPTCFCHTEREQTSIDGNATEHVRQWDTCFSAEHSYLHGRLLRPDTRTRYRQWLTHKLGGWHDQYGRSGCVGCGRCITWCPVGIDVTEEAVAICGAPRGDVAP